MILQTLLGVTRCKSTYSLIFNSRWFWKSVVVIIVNENGNEVIVLVKSCENDVHTSFIQTSVISVF